MKRNLHAGRRAAAGSASTSSPKTRSTTSTSPRSRCSSAPACSWRTTRRSTSSPTAAARVDRETHMVRIPPHVVDDADPLGAAAVRLCGRDPQRHRARAGRVAFSNFDEGIMVIDPETGEHRDSTNEDVADIARLVDYLSDIDTYESAVGAEDVPPETAPAQRRGGSSTRPSRSASGRCRAWRPSAIIEMAAVSSAATTSCAAARSSASASAR